MDATSSIYLFDTPEAFVNVARFSVEEGRSCLLLLDLWFAWALVKMSRFCRISAKQQSEMESYERELPNPRLLARVFVIPLLCVSKYASPSF